MVLALCGPTQVGKTYAKEAILRHRKDVKELRWYTTKPLSPDETVGRHLSDEQFERNCLSGLLISFEKDDGYKYGFATHDIVRNDVLFVTEICPSLISDLKEINPDVVAISLVTDGLDILKDRLKLCCKSKAELEKRLSVAKEELEFARENYDYFDVAVLVTKKNQKSFRSTVLLLANTLAP